MTNEFFSNFGPHRPQIPNLSDQAKQQSQEPAEVMEEAATTTTPKTVGNFDWLSFNNEALFKKHMLQAGNIEQRVNQELFSPEQMNQLFQTIDEVYQEEFGKVPSDFLRDQIAANILIGRPVIEPVA